METVDLIAVGDVSLVSHDGHDPFEYVSQYLRAGDILFGNLEAALSDTVAAVEKEVTLGTSPQQARYLRHAGFDIVSVANNHILDCGPQGLSETLTTLREQGIRFVGAGDRSSPQGYEIIECKGLRAAFIAYCEDVASDLPPGVFVNHIDPPVILQQLHGLKSQCDIAIVSLHWGIEYAYYPSPKQIELARELIHNGAGLVLGHHPHVVQGVEQSGTGLIVYSMGSFQFEPRREEARPSFMLHARLRPGGVERYRLIPTRINGMDEPQLAKGEEGRKMRRLMAQLSAPIREGRVTEKWWFEQVAPVYLQANLKAWATRMRKYGLRHFVQLVHWLVSGFTIKCYLGLLRTRIGQHE